MSKPQTMLYGLFVASDEPDVTFKGTPRKRPTYERVDARAFPLQEAREYWATRLTGRHVLRPVRRES